MHRATHEFVADRFVSKVMNNQTGPRPLSRADEAILHTSVLDRSSRLWMAQSRTDTVSRKLANGRFSHACLHSYCSIRSSASDLGPVTLEPPHYLPWSHASCDAPLPPTYELIHDHTIPTGAQQFNYRAMIILLYVISYEDQLYQI